MNLTKLKFLSLRLYPKIIVLLSFTFLLSVSAVFPQNLAPTISTINVPQDSITVYTDSCTGIIELSIDDADDDTLFIDIQISSDSGLTWHVPQLSNFFFARQKGDLKIPFTVQGLHGSSCLARATVYDRLETINGKRRIPAKGHIFLMGVNNQGYDYFVHPVAFSRDFLIDTTEIPEAAFKEWMPNFERQYEDDHFYEENPPVESAMWHWATLYANWRSKKDGLDTCYSNFPLRIDTINLLQTSSYYNFVDVTCDFTKNGYRLPTEAEWEYACRAGSMDDYYWGPDAKKADAYCWFKGNYDTLDQRIHSMAMKLPNAFGLYDMCGNMMEVCNDWYGKIYYDSSPLLDPTGPAESTGLMTIDPLRVVRGGHFENDTKYLFSAMRMNCMSSCRHPQSFRLVRTIFE